MLDAQHFGVPQRRRRVFLVGCLGDNTGPCKVLFEREGSDWDLAESGQEREDDSPQIENSTGEYGDHRGHPVIYTANAIRTGSSLEHTVCPTLRATHSKLGDNFPSIVVEHDLDSSVITPLYARSGSSPSSDDFAPNLQPKMVIEKTWVMGSSQSNAVMEETSVSSTLTAAMGSGGGHVPMIVDEASVYHSNHSQRTPTEHAKCPTLLAWMGTGGNNIPMIVDQGYYENHPQDSRVKGPFDVAKSVTATYGTGGGNIPFIVEQFTFKERDFGEYRECTIGANLRASGGTLGAGS